MENATPFIQQYRALDTLSDKLLLIHIHPLVLYQLDLSNQLIIDNNHYPCMQCMNMFCVANEYQYTRTHTHTHTHTHTYTHTLTYSNIIIILMKDVHFVLPSCTFAMISVCISLVPRPLYFAGVESLGMRLLFVCVYVIFKFPPVE